MSIEHAVFFMVVAFNLSGFLMVWPTFNRVLGVLLYMGAFVFMMLAGHWVLGCLTTGLAAFRGLDYYLSTKEDKHA